MTSAPVTAAAAGTWKLGDLTVNRMGFGAMRLPQPGRALAPVVCAQNRRAAAHRGRDDPPGVLAQHG